jgi:hypothetical protein
VETGSLAWLVLVIRSGVVSPRRLASCLARLGPERLSPVVTPQASCKWLRGAAQQPLRHRPASCRAFPNRRQIRGPPGMAPGFWERAGNPTLLWLIADS